MQNLEWYLADLTSTGKNTIETVEKSLTDMFIRLVRIYPCLKCLSQLFPLHLNTCVMGSKAVINIKILSARIVRI